MLDGFGLNTSVLNVQSEKITSFCPVRVFVNYDGGDHKKRDDSVKGRIHLKIMRTAFCSPSVDVIVSSRTNMNIFSRYFSQHMHKLCGSVWKCIFLSAVDFGGSKLRTYIWFRLTPMQNVTVCFDPRIEQLVLRAGFLIVQ